MAAHPIVETKWELDKMRVLMHQLDEALDEADYRAAQAEEAIEQASKWEEAKENVESLVQRAVSTLELYDENDVTAALEASVKAINLLDEVLKELNK